MRQRDVGDGHVEDLHDHRPEDRDHDQAAVLDRGRIDHGRRIHRLASYFTATGVAGRTAATGVAGPASGLVSTLTDADSPTRRVTPSSGAVMCTSTGTRCTTLTQLPVAFCAGRSENSDPVPAPIEATTPVNVRPG